MRSLLYIPMIHADADLGSMALFLNRRSLEICGRERWLRHKEIVAEYWDKIRTYFDRVDPNGLAIYQDGLMADGELGRKIIQEGAERGSPNHQIVLDLVMRGSMIRKTEDIELLKKEFHRVLQLAETDLGIEEELAINIKREGEQLMAERDRFIAETINRTLQPGERGALFIGAFHNVLPGLEKDIAVREVKASSKVKEYFEAVISCADDEAFERLARYMVSDV
jgi:hypothetical protein